MPEISSASVTALADPKIREIATTVFKTAILAAEKAVAHSAQPANYPMPSDTGCLENIFLRRFRELAADNQQLAIRKVLSFIDAGARRQDVYGPLHKVDLRGQDAVETQMLRLKPLPRLSLESAYLENMSLVGHIVPPSSALMEVTGIVNFGSIIGTVISYEPPSPPHRKLQICLHHVRCIDETNPEIWSSDTILLGAATVDAEGNKGKVGAFTVGDFNDGDVVSYAPNSPHSKFAEFDITSSKWPKRLYVTIALAEKDSGGFPDFLDSLYSKVVDVIKELVKGLLSFTGAFADIVGAAVGWVMNKILGWIKDWWDDDLFDPVTVAVEIPSSGARWSGQTTSPKFLTRFVGHGGEYEIGHTWRLVK